MRKSCEEKSVTSILLKNCFQADRLEINIWVHAKICEIISVLMSKYSCVTKDITCLIYENCIKDIWWEKKEIIN